MPSFRRFQRRYLPFLPEGKQIRHWRNRMLRKIGLARALEPPTLTEHPELRIVELLPLVAADHVLEHGSLTFLQIGAFDGVGDDVQRIIERHPVRGVLVEPQPAAFARLKERYGRSEQIHLVNAAVDRMRGTRSLYTSARGAVPFASFDRGHLVRHGIPEHDITALDIDCLTVDDVLERAGFDSLDLLQVDAEGYDHEILASFDFDRWAPRIVRFEFRHIPGPELDACLLMLASHGYRFLIEKLDVIAVRASETPDRLPRECPDAG